MDKGGSLSHWSTLNLFETSPNECGSTRYPVKGNSLDLDVCSFVLFGDLKIGPAVRVESETSSSASSLDNHPHPKSMWMRVSRLPFLGFCFQVALPQVCL